VDDIDAALRELREKGIRLIDEKPRYGAEGTRIAFIHMKSLSTIF
jgi:methylmalonyl-CoA/ethylmalonyl-CoA epimerase